MEFQRIQNAIELLGSAKVPMPPAETPGAIPPAQDEPPSANANGEAKRLGAALPLPRPVSVPIEPRLHVPWGSFRQSFASSLFALFGPRASKNFLSLSAFRDCCVEGRIPARAVLAAALWHVVFVAMPFPNLPAPRKNPAFENVELTWSGPIDNLPPLEIPRAAAKPPERTKPADPPPAPVPVEIVEAFHPRQRIFTDPVHPTHPRQTLINPAAPVEPPKMLPNLPNNVQLQEVAAPARPKLQISAEVLKQLHPREKRPATVTSAPLPDVPNMEPRLAEISLATVQNGPPRPKLELNAGAAPRIVGAQSGDAAPAPQIAATQLTSADGGAIALIALSATPAPPAAVVQPPQGNLAARIAMSPEGKRASREVNAPLHDTTAKSSIAVSISGDSPLAAKNPEGLAGATKINAPSPRLLIPRPEPRVLANDDAKRTSPPDFAALPRTAKPEVIFAPKKVYTLDVNMPNTTSATGSWIVHFSELRANSDQPGIASGDLSGPVPLKKVDPKYPPRLVSERVEGEVVLYAIIRQDGTVDSIQLVRGIDKQLDENAMSAFGQWKFRPATKAGAPVELEAIVHVPFRASVPQY